MRQANAFYGENENGNTHTYSYAEHERYGAICESKSDIVVCMEKYRRNGDFLVVVPYLNILTANHILLEYSIRLSILSIYVRSFCYLTVFSCVRKP